MITLKELTLIPARFLLREPFVTAAGRKTETHNLQIVVRLSNGIRGYAEASTSIAMKDQTLAVMHRALSSLRPALIGLPIADELPRRPTATDLSLSVNPIWQKAGDFPTAAAALESALFDAYARSAKIPLWRMFGTRCKEIETDLTLSVGEPATLYVSARLAVKRGFRKLKVKLAGDSAMANFERLAAVHQAAPRSPLLADGNQGFGFKEAVALAKKIRAAKLPVLFFEQPFPKTELATMRRFRREKLLPLLADESVLTPRDALKVFEAQAADAVNIKLAKSGLSGALEIVAIAKRFGKKIAIGCMEESKLGLAASVHLACGLGNFSWVDLDSVFLLKAQRLAGGFDYVGPRLSVKKSRRGIDLGR